MTFPLTMLLFVTNLTFSSEIPLDEINNPKGALTFLRASRNPQRALLCVDKTLPQQQTFFQPFTLLLTHSLDLASVRTRK